MAKPLPYKHRRTPAEEASDRAPRDSRLKELMDAWFVGSASPAERKEMWDRFDPPPAETHERQKIWDSFEHRDAIRGASGCHRGRFD